MRLGRVHELLLAGAIAFGGTCYVLTTRSDADTKWASSSQMIQEQFLQEGDVRPLSPSAARVALTALSMDADPIGRDSVAALSSAPAAQIDLGSAGMLQLAILNSDSGDIAYDLFAADANSNSAVVLDRGPREATLAVNYQRPFETMGRGAQLDVSFTPRAAVSLGPDGSAAGAGAEVRVGRYLAESLADRPSWYMFAGADRRALLYDPAQGTDFTQALSLTRREVIGDLQAGVAMRIGDTDLSVAYVRRDYKHVAGVTSFDETESFGAVSLNWAW
ncbi:MAG: DUF2219 family protein [Maricaulis sp.]|nr:DUF2219 family protein [Maricaulis sp.]MDG2044030.1 DUF2219 family protein [Maricaulis sp.]